MDSRNIAWDNLRERIGKLFRKPHTTREEWYAIRDDLEIFREENFRDANWGAFCWKNGLETVYMTISGFEYDEEQKRKKRIIEELAKKIDYRIHHPVEDASVWLELGKEYESFLDAEGEDGISELQKICPFLEAFVMILDGYEEGQELD